jgi:hypothetical protein
VTGTLVVPEIRRDGGIPERIDTSPVSIPRRSTSRERQLVVVSLAVIVLAAWFIASFWISVDVRSPQQPYLAPTAHQPWVRSAGSGPHAFFRLELPISSMPQSATLWLDADQTAIPYVDGAPLANIPKIDTFNGSYIPRLVEILDLRPALTTGANVIGLEVINYDNRPPAFQARIRLQTGALVQIFGTKASEWSSTTDVARTDQTLPRSGSFATTTFTPADWAPATFTGERIGATTVSTPPAAYSLPADGEAIVGTNTGHRLTVSTTLTLPPGCTSGWLRVAANGSYTVSLGGQVVAAGAGTWQQLGVQPSFIPLYLTPLSGSIPLTIYDLCPVARGGANLLSISVDGTSAPLVYADGQVSDGTSVTRIAMGPSWTASGFAQPPLVANPEVLLRNTFQDTAGTTIVPAGPRFAHTLEIFLGLCLIAGAVAFLLVLLGKRRGRALRAVAAGTLPALGLVFVLIQFRHFIGVQPPFPSTPLVLHIVLIAAAAGIALAAGLTLSSAPVRPASLHVVERTPGPRRVPVDRRTPARHPRKLVAWLRARPYGLAVFAIALFWVLILSYRIDYQQLWQDELSSVAAAQGIGAHLVPRWPSGFLYWKSELYSALLAVIGTLTHYRTSYLREMSVLWFGGTVMLFGTRLIPLVIRRRSFQLAGTVIFASAALEQSHAQEVRMYQMVQFFVVLLAIVLLRAVREPTTRRVAVVMIVVVCMYLSHEESFGVLPLLPITLFGFLGLSWCKNWRWWVFGGLAAMCIATQLALAELTHPPSFGVDLSGGPLLQWSPRPFYYIVNVFFTSGGQGAVLTIISLFAVVGVIIGWRQRDHTAIYLAAFWIIPTIVVSLLLPAKNPRYVFITLPFVFLLATRAASDIYQFLRGAMTTGERGASRSARRVLTIILALTCGLAALMSTAGSLTDYGPITEVLFGADVQHDNVGLDFPNAVAYVKAHEDRGDAVIAVGPANLTGGSLGHAPTYWLPANRTHNLLYVFEKDNRAVDTEYGIPVLLNAPEFEAAIDAHRRVWLVASDSNANRFLPAVRNIVESRFKLVYEGESVSVFLCTN